MVTLVIDGTSTMNMVRQLPLTNATIASLGGVVLHGHHKTGMGSFENIRDLFAANDKDASCGVTTKYKEQGWTTMVFGEAGIMTLDGRNFSINYEMAYAWKWSDAPQRNSKCLKEELNHKPQFAVIEGFLKAYQNTPTLAHIHLTEYTHDSINMAALYDADLSSMVIRLQASGALNDTFLVILGDHGFWLWSTFYWTPQGRVENNMPMTVVLPPPGFAEEHPEKMAALRANGGKLTSHRDTNRMIRHLLAMSTGKEEEDLFPGTAKEAGESLFREVGDRGCREAGIPLPFCSCNREELQPESVREAVEAALKDMDTALNYTSLCQPLELDKVIEANKVLYEGVTWIQAAVVVVPKKVEFLVELSIPPAARDMSEATAELKWRGGTFSSACVKGHKDYSSLKNYCICKE